LDKEDFAREIGSMIMDGTQFTDDQMILIKAVLENWSAAYDFIESMNQQVITQGAKNLLEEAIIGDREANASLNEAIETTTRDLENLTEEMYDFGDAREQLFFGGRYGNVTGSLYKQVVKQGVGVLYNKMDIVMSNNFHGFFNEREAADRIIAVLNEVAPSLTNA